MKYILVYEDEKNFFILHRFNSIKEAELRKNTIAYIKQEYSFENLKIIEKSELRNMKKNHLKTKN